MGRGASLAEVHGVAKSQTQLTEHSLKRRWDTKQLSSWSEFPVFLSLSEVDKQQTGKTIIAMQCVQWEAFNSDCCLGHEVETIKKYFHIYGLE